MKKLLLLLIPILAAFILVSCEDSTTDPPEVGKGSIKLSSVPSGAEILLDNVATGKVTPATLTDLDPKSYNVTLKFTGYRDTTVSVSVTENLETVKHVDMTQNPPVLSPHSGIKIYERQSTNLSGLDLSTGSRTGSGVAETDIYYEGTVGSAEIIKSQHLRLPTPTTTKTTRFNNATGTSINDGTDSPVYQSGGAWVFEKAATNNYSFLYDQDNYYSKLKIVQTGQDGPFDKWVEIDYIFNETLNDPRF